MKNNQYQNFYQNLVKELVNQATSDSFFKESLVRDPKQTIRTFLKNEDLKFKDNIKFEVEDQSNQKFIYINIPKKVNVDELELTEEELEQVSGGATTTALCVGVLVYVVTEFLDGVAEGISNRVQ